VCTIHVEADQDVPVNFRPSSSLRSISLLDQPLSDLKALDFLKQAGSSAKMAQQSTAVFPLRFILDSSCNTNDIESDLTDNTAGTHQASHCECFPYHTQVPELCVRAFDVFFLGFDASDLEWLEDMTEAYHDPASGQPHQGWPPPEVHRALPLLAACNLHGPVPDGPSAYSRCITLNLAFLQPADIPVSEASAHLVADKVGVLGLASNVLDPDYFSGGPDVILHLGRCVVRC
jgi:hypothetical protein